jgi:hypothetical protein
LIEEDVPILFGLDSTKYPSEVVGYSVYPFPPVTDQVAPPTTDDGITYTMPAGTYNARASQVWVNGTRQRLNLEYTEDPAAGQIIFNFTLDPAVDNVVVIWVD